MQEDPKGNQVNVEKKEREGLVALVEKTVRTGNVEKGGLLVHVEIKDLRELREIQELQEHQEKTVLLVPKEKEELKGLRDCQD